jgi:hypothetical protein
VKSKISFVGAKMFNIKNNRSRSIKHIQNTFFDGLDVIMTCDFYQTPLMKDGWIFQNIKDNVRASHQIFDKHIFNVMT